MHTFAPGIVWHTDHGAFRDGGVVVKRFLGLGGIDVFPATDDHVLHAIDDEDKALIVHVTTVPGMQPTIT